MMSQEDNFPYYENNEIKLLELPYKGDQIVMDIIIPAKHDADIATVEKSLTAAKLDEYFKKLKTEKVDLALPKFKMNWGVYRFNDALKALGMPDAFDGRADFSNITGRKGLYIDAVLHKSFVDVNEKGTEAAAVTAVVKLEMMIPDLKFFRANRPFIFIIRDKATGQYLFVGKLTDPSKLK